MKRKIALLLALVMVLSMVPMMSFAASDNRVTSVPTVKDDHKFTMTSAPELVIEEKDNDWGTRTQRIRLKLDNAEWLYAGTTSVAGAVYGNNDFTQVDVTKDSDTTVTVEFTKNAGASPEAALRIPLFTEVTDPGDVTVKIEARGSSVNEGTYVFAKSSDGKAIVTIDGDVTLSQGSKDLKTIEIDEANPGSYTGNKTIKFKLSSGFIWDETNASAASKVRVAGGYTGGTATAVVDDEELRITFTGLSTTAGTTNRGTIFVEGLDIKAEMDAKYGDVNMTVTGADVDTTTLLVAKYKDYGVIVKADGDAKELVAGKFETRLDDEAHELQKLIIKEDIAGSWLTNRRTEIEFPSWVKITHIQESKQKNISGDISYTFDKSGNRVELVFDKNNDDSKAEIELTFYVSVEADATGDITARVSGKALDEEHEIVLGKAIAPIEVKTDVKDIKLGVQKQELGKLTLTENVAGAFMKSGDVTIALEHDAKWATEPTVKVVDGEGLRIERVKTAFNRDNNREELTFRVTRESEKPATIEITGMEVNLYRTLPEGEFKVYVGGGALVRNYSPNYRDYDSNENETNINRNNPQFKVEWAAEPVVAKVITPADETTTTKEVVLTIGSTTMFVDGVSETANAAPYIDSADRTMLPVSAIGRALGATVEWNNAARTVLVTKGNDRVLLTIGSDTMNVNGMSIPMRSKAVITGERTFVPLKDLGVALGVGVEWDAATRTVTVK